MNHEEWGVQRWAIHLSQLLNAANPPDRYRFDVGALAKEVSKNFFPEDPITQVIGADLEDCEGALQPSLSRKRWGIYYSLSGSPQRRRFTTAHEFGHYLCTERNTSRDSVVTKPPWTAAPKRSSAKRMNSRPRC